MSNAVPIGKLLDGHGDRDAIHVAIAPVKAACPLLPGQEIGFVSGDDTELVGHSVAKHIGIVDPFLKGIVPRDARFWMFLYPNTITSLRHDWTHPDFSADYRAETPSTSESEKWLRAFAEEVELSYAGLLKAAKEWIEYEDYKRLSFDTPDICYSGNELFWKHYQIVTGETVEKDKQSSFFTCSC